MAKIYFRRQATVPVTGTNGIFTICTGNKTLYMDGEEYGGGGTISGITLDTWFKERVTVPIVDKVAQIDLTDMARQEDVKRLLDDVFVIKQELELNGPLNPSADPRSAIDILHEDVTNIQRELNGVKSDVSANTAGIKENYDSIVEMGDDILTMSAMVGSVTKNVAVNAANITSAKTDISNLYNRVGKLEGRERDLSYSAESLYTLGSQNKNKILILEGETITGASINGVAGTVSGRVVNLTAKTYDDDISSLNSKVAAVDRKANSISGNLETLTDDVNQFIDEVAADIETVSGAVDAKVSGITINGVDATVENGKATLTIEAGGNSVKCEAADNSIVITSATTEDKITTYTFKADNSGVLAELKKRPTSVTLNGTKHETDEATGDINLGSIDLSTTVSGITLQSGTSSGASVSDRNAKITLVPCDLKYDKTAGTLQFVDEFGHSGATITLSKDQYIDRGVYNAESQKIILYFNTGDTKYVEIPVSGLVDTYTADETTIHQSGTQFSVIEMTMEECNTMLQELGLPNPTQPKQPEIQK